MQNTAGEGECAPTPALPHFAKGAHRGGGRRREAGVADEGRPVIAEKEHPVIGKNVESFNIEIPCCAQDKLFKD
jgi:hypothetical protein